MARGRRTLRDGMGHDGIMRLRIFTEPQQGADYTTLLRVARATEDLGFDAFFRSDHYLKMGDVSGLPGPTDAWTTLAAARELAAHPALDCAAHGRSRGSRQSGHE